MARGKTSAGILLFRLHGPRLEVRLVHPGGPFWSKKDDGAWTIPKGEFGEGEEPLAAALREHSIRTFEDLHEVKVFHVPREPQHGITSALIHRVVLRSSTEEVELKIEIEGGTTSLLLGEAGIPLLEGRPLSENEAHAVAERLEEASACSVRPVERELIRQMLAGLRSGCGFGCGRS